MKRGVRWAMTAGMVVALTATPVSATTKRENARLHFEIAETTLAQALLRYSELTGLGLVFDSRLVENRTAPALSGHYSARVALDRLLDGTGLRTERVGADILTIVPATPVAEVATAAESDAERAPLQYAATVEAPIDELLIIGTRTANPPYFKFVPSVSLDGQDLQFGGTINVADALFQMPSMLSDITSANTTGFGAPAGLNLADLRGIGSQRTLVLVNGRRYTPTYAGNLALYGVDLNSISASLIERVEVLTGGAATSHGGEAIAGVVNFVLRDKYEGLTLAAQGGISGQGDREEFLATVTYGTNFADGRGNLVASLSVDRQGGLVMDDRQVTSDPSGYALNGRPSSPSLGVLTRGFGRSSVTPSCSFTGYLDGDGVINYLDGRYHITGDGQSYERANGSKQQRYRYAIDHTLLTPIKRVFGSLGTKYDIASGHRLILETSFVENRIESQLAALPLTAYTGLVGRGGRVISIPLDNPYVPDSVKAALLAFNPDATALLLERRATELGPRKTDITRRNLRAMLGLQGVLGHDWTYDVYYQFGRTQVREERDGLLKIDNYIKALDPDLCAATVGCSLINPFGAGHISESQAAFYRAPNAVRRIRADQHIVSAVGSGPVVLSSDVDATLSGGVEFRHESLTDRPDPVLDDAPVAGSFIFPGSDGGFNVIEAFSDLTVPLVEDKPFFEELTVAAGVRLSDFSTAGTQPIWHVGGFWEPSPGLMFRASYQYGGRGPDVAELFSGGPSAFGYVIDPCSEPENDVVAANCASSSPMGVPEGYHQTEYVTENQSFGNPELDAERASNLTVGFTLDTAQALAAFPGSLRLSVDAYRIKVRDFVTAVDGVEALADCYASVNLSSPYCGINPGSGMPYIQRGANGSLHVLAGGLINAGRYWLHGIDIDLQYVADFKDQDLWLPLEQFSLVGRYSRNYKVDIQFRESISPEVSSGSEIIDALGEARYPKHRFHVGSSFVFGDVTLDWDVRYRGATYSMNDVRDLPDARIPAIWYHDVAVRWEFAKNRVFYAGVRNLFDQMGPRVAFGSVGDTLPEYYDVIGRRFFAGFVADF